MPGKKEDKSTPPPQAPLQEGMDFYMENGLFVLTEHFLRKRGYCCRNSCRHCPFGVRKEDRKERPV